jgi:hypothetical protein
MRAIGKLVLTGNIYKVLTKNCLMKIVPLAVAEGI